MYAKCYTLNTENNMFVNTKQIQSITCKLSKNHFEIIGCNGATTFCRCLLRHVLHSWISFSTADLGTFEYSFFTYKVALIV